MSKSRLFIYFISAVAFGAFGMGCGGLEDADSAGTTLGATAKGSGGDVVKVADEGEAAHLIFMREEEKLARDVYLTFATMYPENQVFHNIARELSSIHLRFLVDDRSARFIYRSIKLCHESPPESGDKTLFHVPKRFRSAVT